jgi:L-cysteine/cystine lyase
MDAARLREEFPVFRRLAFLNAGSNGPVPARAVEAAREDLERQAEEGRGVAHFRRLEALSADLRAAYGERLACQPTDVALTTSTSDGVGVALAGLDLGPGDEILTSDLEHPGLNGPLQAARDLRGVEIRAVPLAQVADSVGPRTKLVACSHVSWVTGEVAPSGLGELEIPVLLDGAQGIGAIPVDVQALGCDLYAGSGQKWLCGPIGTGMLYVSPTIRDRLATPRRWYLSFVDATEGLAAQLRPDAARHDSPGISTEAMAFALEAHAVLAEHGWDAVHTRARKLAARFAEALRGAGRDVLPRDVTTLVTWRSDDPQSEVERLADRGVAVRQFHGLPYVRASVGAWNDESDLERLLDALP